MAKLFWRKQHQVEELLAKYCRQFGRCLDVFVEGMNGYLGHGQRSKLAEDVQRTHEAESDADDTRREISMVLYGKALFPESRGDILGLIEALDQVPNKAEEALRMAYGQHIVVPNELTDKCKELVMVVRECVRVLQKATELLFDEFHRAADYYGTVDPLESQADILEAELVEKIFASDWNIGQKILLRDLVSCISSIADRAENAADRMHVMLVKRKL